MKANTERENETPSCAAVAPLLTALFDGEADAHSAQSARAHLLSCERCARAWLDWNQHRTILRNENVPAPPPTLLWRVLLACRLSGYTSRKKSSRKTGVAPQEVVSQRASLFPDAPMPTDLSARILAQTTQRERPALMTLDSNRGSNRFRWRLASWPALAMPALAAWMLMLGQTSQLATVEAPIADSQIVTDSPTGEIEHALSAEQPARSRKAVTSHIAKHDTAPHSAVRSTVARASAPIVTPASSPHVVSSPVANRVEAAQVEVTHEQETHTPEPKARPTLAHVETAPREEREPRAVRPVTFENTQRDVRPHVSLISTARPRLVAEAPDARLRASVVLASAPKTSASSRRSSTVTRRAALSDEVRSPRSRMARPVLAQFSAEDHTMLRSSRPVSKASIEAPRFASLETPDMADEHVEEWQSAVADFRSAVGGDEGTDSFESDAG